MAHKAAVAKMGAMADLVRHQSEPALVDALARAQQVCEQLEALGSYPRAQRVL